MNDDVYFIGSQLGSIEGGNPQNNLQGRAAVLVPLIKESDGFSLLLTQRAAHMTHHGGEVAFPGGMWDPGDRFPEGTALRESKEEIGLSTHQVELLGVLPELPTRNMTQVTPVVGLIPSGLEFVPSPAEIETIFTVPIAELLKDNRIRTDIFSRGNQSSWVPAYDYQGYEIWGFTAWVIKRLLQQCFRAEMVRESSAPEKVW